MRSGDNGYQETKVVVCITVQHVDTVDTQKRVYEKGWFVAYFTGNAKEGSTYSMFMRCTYIPGTPLISTENTHDT